MRVYQVYCHTSCSFFANLSVIQSPQSTEGTCLWLLFAFLINLQHYSVFLKQSMSSHQHISFSFLHLSCKNMMSACRRPPISLMCSFGGSRYRPVIGSLPCLGGKPTSDLRWPDDGLISKSCSPTVLDFATIMLVFLASCHTSYSCFTDSFSQLVQT